MVSETVEMRAKPVRPTESMPVHPATLLLAEDDEALVTLLAELLTLEGYRIVLARNGSEALERAKDLMPDLILMDIQMPGMNGLEAIRRIRVDTELRDIPVIALTALAGADDWERCFEAGANGCLGKPFKLQKLIALIAAQLNEAGSKEDGGGQ